MSSWLGAAAMRFVLLLLLWWVLAEGSLYQWGFGVATAGLATVLSLALLPPLGRWVSAAAVLRFVPFFLRATLLGGVDVGRRAARRPLDVEPTFLIYPLELDTEAARVFFVCLVSLVPGTVSCRLAGRSVEVHVLDRRMDARTALAALERHTAAIFRCEAPVQPPA